MKEYQEGDKIGRYIIKDILGRGGMAIVYQAKDPYMDRDVALKMLNLAFDETSENVVLRQRFEREARVLANVKHFAIVSIHDYGIESDLPFFTMDLLKGKSLHERLTEGPLAIEATNQIVTRLALALDKIHKIGIVHRDLKPNNILFDEDGNAYLGDFGISKLLQGSDLTLSSTVIGTIPYMSPEQIQGQPVTPYSDIYSLGVVLFEMLTGERPYTGDLHSIIVQHMQEPIPSILQRNPKLPSGCDSIIYKALAKDGKKRYQTATALVDAFSNLVSNQSITNEVAMTQITPLKLHQILIEYFSSSELRTLCFDLGLDYSNMGSGGKADHARELVSYMKRHGRFNELLRRVQKLRPYLDWKAIPTRNPFPFDKFKAEKPKIQSDISSFEECPNLEVSAIETIKTGYHFLKQNNLLRVAEVRVGQETSLSFNFIELRPTKITIHSQNALTIKTWENDEKKVKLSSLRTVQSFFLTRRCWYVEKYILSDLSWLNELFPDSLLTTSSQLVIFAIKQQPAERKNVYMPALYFLLAVSQDKT